VQSLESSLRELRDRLHWTYFLLHEATLRDACKRTATRGFAQSSRSRKPFDASVSHRVFTTCKRKPSLCHRRIKFCNSKITAATRNLQMLDKVQARAVITHSIFQPLRPSVQGYCGSAGRSPGNTQAHLNIDLADPRRFGRPASSNFALRSNPRRRRPCFRVRTPKTCLCPTLATADSRQYLATCTVSVIPGVCRHNPSGCATSRQTP